MLRTFFSVAVLLCTCAGLGAQQVMEVRSISQEGYTGKFNYSNADKPGMMIEIMRAIERMDPGLTFSGLNVQASVKRIEHELESGNVDVFFGLAKSDARSSKFVFVEPALYQATYQFAVRADDDVSIGTIEDFKKFGRDSVVLVNSSESNIEYLQAHALTIDASGMNTVINCRKLVAHRGRFYFASTLSIVEEIKAQKLTSAIKLLPTKFLSAGVYALFSRQAPQAMVERVRSDIARLDRSGALKKIFLNYGALE